MFGDRCTKPHQTGMEQRWEAWVKETLNFLAANNVDTYEGGWNANSLEGMNRPKGKIMEIPQRLNIFQETINTRRALYSRKLTELRDEEDAHEKTKSLLSEALALIEKAYLANSGSYDARECLEANDDLEQFAKKHLKHLFEDEEETDDERSA